MFDIKYHFFVYNIQKANFFLFLRRVEFQIEFCFISFKDPVFVLQMFRQIIDPRLQCWWMLQDFAGL